jgi:hypothetical protein
MGPRLGLGTGEKKTNCTTIIILDTTNCPVVYLKHDVSETEYRLRLQVDPIERASFHRYSRSVAQEVSRRLRTAETRVRARVKSCWICGGQSGTGAGFLRVLPFLLPLIHSTNYYTIITLYHQGLV